MRPLPWYLPCDTPSTCTAALYLAHSAAASESAHIAEPRPPSPLNLNPKLYVILIVSAPGSKWRHGKILQRFKRPMCFRLIWSCCRNRAATQSWRSQPIGRGGPCHLPSLQFELCGGSSIRERSARRASSQAAAGAGQRSAPGGCAWQPPGRTHLRLCAPCAHATARL